VLWCSVAWLLGYFLPYVLLLFSLSQQLFLQLTADRVFRAVTFYKLEPIRFRVALFIVDNNFHGVFILQFGIEGDFFAIDERGFGAVADVTMDLVGEVDGRGAFG
jgi:hypothetical protein